jgi:Xaa-Pro aminopeptidase
MVLTVEPGIYCARDGLEHTYLRSRKSQNSLIWPCVEKYLPVGGGLLEDNILITADGYRNPTTAPKGEAMLRRICYGACPRRSDSQI